MCACMRVKIGLWHYFEMFDTEKLYLIRDLPLAQGISILNLPRNEKATFPTVHF